MFIAIRVLCAVMTCVLLTASPLIAAVGGSDRKSSGTLPAGKVSGNIVDYGIVQGKLELKYEIPGSGGENSIVLDEPKIAETTTKVPMKKGTKFGYKWQLVGLISDQPVEIIYRYKHPPMVGPDGKRTEGFDRSIEVQPENGKVESFDGYELSEDYELVPGNWTLSILYQGKVMVTKTFQVVGGKK
jgi:hypothetical protein